MASVFEIRRRNLIAYIEDKHHGNRAEFCRRIGKNPNLINLALTRNDEYRKNIGEKLARNIERLAGMPVGWLDMQVTQPAESSTSLPISTGEVFISGKLWLTATDPLVKKLRSLGNTTLLLSIDAMEDGSLSVSASRVKLPTVRTIPSS